jgi:biopolymer transport protein ExbD
MPIRKKKKHMAEVNMSSMTDIIFMLLVFFMLTSTLVKFMQYKLPESDQRTKNKVSTIVGIEKTGRLTVNNYPVRGEQLEATLRSALYANGRVVLMNPAPSVTIAAEIGVPFEDVNKIMILANRLKARATLATDPRE